MRLAVGVMCVSCASIFSGYTRIRRYKKSAVGGKKSPACASRKSDYLISCRYITPLLPCSLRWTTTSNCFFYRQWRTFWTANGRFFYHAGCCRHAAHGVGDGGDDKEENSFSNWRHRRQQKGEADNSRHGFLYLYHPIYYVLLQVTPTANRNSYKVAISRRRYLSRALRYSRDILA